VRIVEGRVLTSFPASTGPDWYLVIVRGDTVRCSIAPLDTENSPPFGGETVQLRCASGLKDWGVECKMLGQTLHLGIYCPGRNWWKEP
jgi:hypothetical protein